MLHSMKYISSFFVQLSVIKHAKTYIFISLITHSFKSIMLYWFYFIIISGREVSIPVIPVYAPSLVYTASKGLKDKDVLPVGSECVYGKWRGIDLHWREPPTHTERDTEKERDERELVFSSLGIKGSEPHLSTRPPPYIMTTNCIHLTDR